MFHAVLQQLTAVEMNTISILWLLFMTGCVLADGASKPLPNVVAIVGKPFVHLLSTEILGTDINYKVFQDGKSTLPQWLSYDPANNVLQGVPTSRDRKTLRIIAHGAEAVEFTLEVKDLEAVSENDNVFGTNHTKLQELRPPDCKNGIPLTVATISFDLCLKSLSGKARMDLIKKASLFADVPFDQFYMSSGRGHDTALHMNEVTVLTAGPGDISETTEQGVAVSWPVGCGIDMAGTRVASKFKSTAETNSFKHTFGVPVSGWHLVSGFLKKSKKRIRRQVTGNNNRMVTATPVATAIAPVSKSDSTTTVLYPTATVVSPLISAVASSIEQSVLPTIERVPEIKSESGDASSSLKQTAFTTVTATKVQSTAFPSAFDVTSLPDLPTRTSDMIIAITKPSTSSSTPQAAASPTETLTTLQALLTRTSDVMVAITKPSTSSSTPQLAASPTETLTTLSAIPTRVSDVMVVATKPSTSSSTSQLAASPTETPTLSAIPKRTSDVIIAITKPSTSSSTPPLAASPTETYLSLSSTVHALEEMSSTVVEAVSVPSIEPAKTTATRKKINATESSISMLPTTSRRPVSTGTKPTNVSAKPVTTPPVVWINSPPRLNYEKVIHRIIVFVGQKVLYRIPEDLFYDNEDGNTRNLTLQLQTRSGKPVSSNSWIKLHQDRQEIYGLPLDESFKLYFFKLVATDSGQKSAWDDFEIVVQEAPEVNSLTFGVKLLLDYDTFIKNTSLHMLLLEKVASVFGVNVTNVRVLRFAKGSVMFSFTFDFLQKEPCSHDEIKVHISNFQMKSGDLSEKFRRSLLPEFPVESGNFLLSESCRDIFYASETKRGPKTEEDRAWWIYAIIPAVALVALLIIACVVIIRRKQKKKEEKDFMKDRSAYLHLFQKTPTVMEDEYELKDRNPLM